MRRILKSSIITCFHSQVFNLMSLLSFAGEEENDFVLNLFGLYPIDNWIECRRDGYIEVCKQYMEGARNIVTKTVGKDREYGRCEEHKNDTNVRTTRAESLLASILGWKIEDCTED